MTRRQLGLAALALGVPAFGEEAATTLRGKLLQTDGQPPRLQIAGGKLVDLQGDDSTTGVLNDARLRNADLEIIGSSAGGKFQILPIHKRAMFVHKDGKRLFVTYWCEICSIRTYTPGKCLCCQDETALDLKEKLDE